MGLDFFVGLLLNHVEAHLPLLFVTLRLSIELLQSDLQLAEDNGWFVRTENGSGLGQEGFFVEIIHLEVCELHILFGLLNNLSLFLYIVPTHVDLATCGHISVDTGFLLGSSLCDSFLFLSGLNSGLALSELFGDFGLTSAGFHHPGMSNHIHKVQSLGRIVLKHVGDEIFEVLTEEAITLRFCVVLPEQIGSVGHQQLVMGVGRVGLGEWRVTSIQNEQDDTEGEQINLVTLVGLVHNQLGSHVGNCSQAGVEIAGTVTTSHRCSETEVSNLDVELLIEHDVFWLKISVSMALVVSVMHGLEHLLEVSTADSLLEAREGNKVEQFATIHEFKSHVGHTLFAATRLVPSCVGLEVNQLYNVLVLELFVSVDLVLKSLEGLLSVGRVVLGKDFKGN